jgi:hypothetical protein
LFFNYFKCLFLFRIKSINWIFFEWNKSHLNYKTFFVKFKVNGNWGSWSSFDSCTQTCGGGRQKRTRICNNPEPLNGGENCPGRSTESQRCNIKQCSGIFKILIF